MFFNLGKCTSYERLINNYIGGTTIFQNGTEMKSMVVYSSKPRKMLSFSTTKNDNVNVNVLCIDPWPATEKLTFYATKSSKSKENSQTSNR